MLFKQFAEMISVVISDTLGNLLDTAVLLLQQKLSGFFHAEIDQIIDRRIADLIFKDP